MTSDDNPYQASDSALPVVAREGPPLIVKAAIAGYLLVYAMQVSVVLYSDLGDMRNPMLGAMVAKGLFVAMIATALWWRQQWARVWVAFATILAVFGLVKLLGPSRHVLEEVGVASHILRIAVACLLFLPSVRRWFARRAPSVA